MSTEVSAQTLATAGASEIELRVRRWDPLTAKILRFSLGVTAAVSLAFAFQWPLSNLTPILTATFLTLPAPSPTLRAGLNLVGYVVFAFGLGLLFTVFLLPYPLVYLPVLAVVLFHIYYLLHRGGPVFLVLMCLISVLVLPMLAITLDALAVATALYFSLSAAFAVAIYLAVHGLIRDPPPDGPRPAKAKRAHGYSRPAAEAALKCTVVILPLAAVFITASWLGAILLLLFAAIYTMNPDLSAGKGAGTNSLKATFLGGLAAMVFMLFLAAVPEFIFLVVLMVLFTLLFGTYMYSDRALAKYLPSASVAFVLLIGSSTSDGASFVENFLGRMGWIFLTTLYVIGALSVLDRFWPRPAAVVEGADG